MIIFHYISFCFIFSFHDLVMYHIISYTILCGPAVYLYEHIQLKQPIIECCILLLLNRNIQLLLNDDIQLLFTVTYYQLIEMIRTKQSNILDRM